MSNLALRATAAVLLAFAAVSGGCAAASQVAPPTAPPPQGAAPSAQAALSAEISVAQASALRDAGAFILDVREPDEWAAGHIPGATLIPLGQLAARLDDVPHDTTVVVVCRSGNRSAAGRDILRQAGFTSVASMAGGMNDWTAAGLPVTAGP